MESFPGGESVLHTKAMSAIETGLRGHLSHVLSHDHDSLNPPSGGRGH